MSLQTISQPQHMLPADTFRNDVVLITAGSESGPAVASELAHGGAAVAVVGGTSAQQDAIASALASLDARSLAVACDVTDPAAIAAAFDKIEAALGSVSILVNAASHHEKLPATTMSADVFRETLAVEFDAAFFCSAEFARRRIARESPGSILFLLSPNAHADAPGYVHLAAARGGLENLTKTLAVEWARDGIRVNGIIPPPAAEESARWQRDARELAWAASYLCSPHASYITGHLLVADGMNSRAVAA